MGKAVAKQFLPLGDMPMLAHTLLMFQRASEIDEIIPILSKEDMEICLKDIIEQYHITKVKTLVVGGKERQDSVQNGLQKLEKDASVVLIHDGVRPFVTQALLRQEPRDKLWLFELHPTDGKALAGHVAQLEDQRQVAILPLAR